MSGWNQHDDLRNKKAASQKDKNLKDDSLTFYTKDFKNQTRVVHKLLMAFAVYFPDFLAVLKSHKSCRNVSVEARFRHAVNLRPDLT